MGAFGKAATAAKEANGDLDKFVQATGTGGMKFLNVGEYDVTITGVDPSQVHQGYCKFVYEDKYGAVKEDQMFVLNKEKTDISFMLAKLLAALFSDVETYGLFLEAVDEDPKNFSMLNGLKLKLSLGRSDGYYVKKLDENSYAAFDASSGDPVEGLVGADAKVLHEEAKAKGFRRSWTNIDNFKQKDVAFNIDRIKSSVKGKDNVAHIRAQL